MHLREATTVSIWIQQERMNSSEYQTWLLARLHLLGSLRRKTRDRDERS
jgi:hypothetical protein